MKNRHFVRDISKLVAAGDPIDVFYARFCRLLQAEFAADSVGIALREGDVLRNAHATSGFFAEESRLVSVLYSGRPECSPHEILAPVQFGNRVVGVLWICAEKRRPFDSDAAELAEICALQLAVKIHDETASKAHSDLQVLAQTDPLTGLWNRGAFERSLMEEWNRASRGSQLSVLMIDIDFFKAFNDRYGHVAGDVALRQVSAVLKEAATRPADMAARYGGEEFAIILAGTDLDGAIAVAEKIRRAVTKAAIAHPLSTLRLVSISVGVATRDAAISTAWELIEAADRALYRAKESGRNRVAASEYASEAEPALLRYERRDNLPAQLSRFIGRDAEIADLRARLNATRLLTLTGTGGIGKTRLGLQLAGLVATQYEHGVWFVDLSAVKDKGEVLAVIANVISAQEKEREPLIDTIVAALEGRTTLLIFDNCEHVIDFAAAAATQLLQRLAKVKMLATSREALAIDGETTYRVPPLRPQEAQELFVDRASSITGTSLASFEAGIVGTICEQLDGIPMAVELAAGALRAMPAADLVRHLHDRLSSLAHGTRTAVPRHKTLRSLIDWSYELLNTRERQMLRALSVFRGGFTVNAAAAVAAVDDTSAAAMIRRLDEKSLIGEMNSTVQQYRLLESVRQYAAEKLAHHGETERAKSNHAAFYCALAQDNDAVSSCGSVSAWLPLMLPERSNLTAALEWSLEEGNSPQVGARLAALLVRFFVEIGAEREAERWVRLALNGPDVEERTRGYLLYGLARVTMIRGDHATVRDAIAPALEIFGRLGDERGLAYAGLAMGGLLAETGDFARAGAYLQNSLTTFRELGETRSVVGVLTSLGIACCYQGDYARGRAAHEEALSGARKMGSELLPAVALGNLAEVDFFEGDVQAAMQRATEAIRYFSEHSGSAFLPVHQCNLASYHTASGEYDKALPLLHAALESLRLLPMGLSGALAFDCVANVPTISPETAIRVAGFASAYFENGAPRLPVREQLHRAAMQRLESSLGLQRVKELIAAGRAMDYGAVIDLAVRAVAPSATLAQLT